MARSLRLEGDPQTRQRMPLARSHRMKEEGVPPTQQRAHPEIGQGREGSTQTRQHDTPAHSQGKEEEGDPPILHHAHLAHGMQERNRGGHPDPEVEGGDNP